MRSKIKEVEYADGRLEYVAKYKRSFIEDYKYYTPEDDKISFLTVCVLFFWIVVPVYLTEWKEKIFNNLHDAKDFVSNAELDLQKRKIEYFNGKMSKKKVSTKIISKK